MKKIFLLMVVSALLVMPGSAQTPAAGSYTGEATINGCLGGSDGNYTVAEEGTNQIVKISSSSVDLELHLGQDVSLIGHKTSGAASSDAADNSIAVTGLNVTSEHCVATAVTPAVTAAPPVTTGSPSPGTTVSAPSAAAAASTPAASTPAAPASPSATASTPAADAAVPAATASPSSATTGIPAVGAAAPTETVLPSAAVVSTSPVAAAALAAKAVHPTRPSAHPRTHSAKQAAAATAPAATVSPSSETVIPAAADAATRAAPAGPSAETAGTPAPAATTPTATHKGRSLWLMILLAVLIIALATIAPFLFRWRKRKMLERTGTPNLSLTHEASSGRDKLEPGKAA
jgi:hypothetical protein